ncbi:hypothetical protein BG53_15650 [Paenibacillus darwinianus]|uniref:HAMP domain-containing protein n=1 Tax=Paenibacillus darwinianus TaxID=1380763 RepID=A0A9W5S157_9BACL|nr:sensor histidine kinase [Paenibacillus darwinianus]EXX89491.1 hypothetical protein BG53_15650 [Paenibacillus darwinianus]EXX91178.1 hypothetical protein CH50_13995 [Paenibacillus darwinianus]EXX92528.1 hypothetical protein BG52_10810 [Paenibacillus darwinianus]
MKSLLLSLKRILVYLSLKHKLFVILVAISIVPTAIVSYSSQYFMFRSGTEYSSSISSQYVQSVSKDLTAYLQDVSDSFDSLFTNSAFQRFMETPPDDLVAQAGYTIDYQPIQRQSLQERNEILGVLYMDKLGKTYFDSYQKRFDFNYPLASDRLYGNMDRLNETTLSAPHPLNYALDTKETVFSFMRPVYNLRTGSIGAWFSIEISEDKIKSLLSGPEYEQEGHLLLYHDSNNAAVSNVNMEDLLLRDFRNALHLGPRNNREFMFTSDAVRYEVTYSDLPYGDWKLVWIAPLSSMTKGAAQSTSLTLLIAVASFSISLFVAYPMMNIVLRPLSKLKQGMARLGRGSYHPISEPSNNDEIGFLIHGYNQMLNELKRMEQEVVQSKLKEKERELLQLQAQINPHFLFNTLETIESYAGKNNGEAVGEMVQSVSRMMRYSVRNDGGRAPLKEELAYIRNFLTIHYYRNGTDVDAVFEVDPAALDIPIMKLSIQPFVENAIKYGWSPHMNPGAFTLTVMAHRQEDMLLIEVHDTGMSMPDDVMDKLNRLIDSRTEQVDPFFRNHTGILNVYRRFLLAYGERVRFQIRTEPERGTRIRIELPLV